MIGSCLLLLPPSSFVLTHADQKTSSLLLTNSVSSRSVTKPHPSVTNLRRKHNSLRSVSPMRCSISAGGSESCAPGKVQQRRCDHGFRTISKFSKRLHRDWSFSSFAPRRLSLAIKQK